MRNRVVLPAPFGPTSPTFSPGLSWNEASTNRICRPYCLLMCEREIIAVQRTSWRRFTIVAAVQARGCTATAGGLRMPRPVMQSASPCRRPNRPQDDAHASADRKIDRMPTRSGVPSRGGARRLDGRAPARTPKPAPIDPATAQARVRFSTKSIASCFGSATRRAAPAGRNRPTSRRTPSRWRPRRTRRS